MRTELTNQKVSKSVLKVRISNVNTMQNTKNKNHYFQFIPCWLERLVAPNRSKQRIIRTTIWKYDFKSYSVLYLHQYEFKNSPIWNDTNSTIL